MRLIDINVLVGAYRADAPQHSEFRAWLLNALASDEPFALCDPVVGGFVRVVTHPRVFRPPSSAAEAFSFIHALRARANHVHLAPGPRHFALFERLCVETPARGNLVTDAWNAALALEVGCTLVSADGDYGRFSGLRWQHPLRA